MGQKRLANVSLSVTWTTLVGALEGALRALGGRPTTHELMGITGHAFRVAVTEHDGILAAGPTAIAIDLPRALSLYRNTGRKLDLIVAARDDRGYVKQREDALKRIRKNIDRGRPALAYDLHIPEFGIIHGYDDRARTLAVSSLMSGQYGETLAESRWPVPERPAPLIVLLIGDREKVDTRRARTAALTFAIAYAVHGDPGDPTGAVHGLAAFTRWREALAQGHAIDPSGHARLIQIVQTARRDAAAFLLDTATLMPRAAEPLAHAAAAYHRVALTASRMATLFPYPSGGEIGSAGMRAAAAASLREAEAHERDALGMMERALVLM